MMQQGRYEQAAGKFQANVTEAASVLSAPDMLYLLIQGINDTQDKDDTCDELVAGLKELGVQLFEWSRQLATS